MLRPTRFEASRRRWPGLLLTTIWRDEFRRSNNFVASVSKWTRRVSNNTNTVAPKTVTEKNSKTRVQKRSAEIFSRAISTNILDLRARVLVISGGKGEGCVNPGLVSARLGATWKRASGGTAVSRPGGFVFFSLY